MRFSIVTLFPEMFESVLGKSLLGRAREAGILAFDFVSPRQFATDRHLSVDDAPYGGGPGMVMKAEPTLAAIATAAGDPPAHRILLSPAGTPFSHRRAMELAAIDHLVLVCGRYEGVDERVAMVAIDEEISIGDFVLTGGELGAMTIIDAIARHVPGVLGDPASVIDESHAGGLLEYPCFTRPQTVAGIDVPAILQSGNHGAIATWRHDQAVRRTAARRPDLLARYRPPAGVADPVAEAAARTFV
ncbi:MAG TPA: tRNA (guanosine(37)-N1)-methyltransferase TrmD, partial [Kofleriaceae bacterium]|nr:tRNA (guanosine(37)-N1)-methyltransferase TrmD [Kofleriaceae bacterium]